MALPGVSPRTGGPIYGSSGDLPDWARAQDALSDDVEIVLSGDDPFDGAPRRDPLTGAMEIPLADGAIVVDLAPLGERAETEEFTENLAEHLSEWELQRIGSDLLEGIQQDDQSRQEWLQTRAKGLDLLGLKVEEAKGGLSGSSAPLEGMSTVRHPLLQEAVLKFQANAYSELCPAKGPAKVVTFGDQALDRDALASSLERDLNYYLTTTATEYYPDTDRMLWWVGYGGMMFKKIYSCPLRRRPVSEMVDAKDLIVSNAVTDMRNAPRVTHEISMRRSVLRRMQILGVYRDISLSDTPADPDVVDKKVAEIQGVAATNQNRPEDQDYALYECYCELSLPGFEHLDEEGEETGLPLPYRVTLEKDSGRILEIRRNWKDGDEDLVAHIPFVAFPFVRGMGFYGIGLLHILGNTTKAVTSAWRLMLDAGMFSNFPGFLFAKAAGRQMTNEFRVPPGGGAPIDTSGMPIRDAIMPLPYKEAGPSLMALTKDIAETGQRVGGTADAPVGEGVQNAPVGTTLALIEQGTKIEGAVHKRLHQAQGEELRLLTDLFRQDPEALWRTNKRSELRKDVTNTLKALEDYDIVPFADPSVPSRMHRLAKVAALKQLQAQSPMLYDGKAVDTVCLQEIGIGNPESLFAPPQAAPAPDPIMQAQLQLKARDLAIKEQKVASDIASEEKDRQLKENLATMQVAERIATHPGSLGAVEMAARTMPRLMSEASQPQAPQMQPPMQPQRQGFPPITQPERFRGLGDRVIPFRSPRPPAGDPNRAEQMARLARSLGGG